MAASSHGNYYDYTIEDYRECFVQLKEGLESAGISLKLYPAMEIFLKRTGVCPHKVPS